MDKDRFTEKNFTEDFDPYPTKKYLAVALIFFAAAFSVMYFDMDGKLQMFHREIFPAGKICYIKDCHPVPLADGDYPLAKPPKDCFVNGKIPLLLVKVEEIYYPLNIESDTLLPNNGGLLPLKILFGFTSPHAENTLKYVEKGGGDPAKAYARKSRYYLHVEDGFGKVRREFYF